MARKAIPLADRLILLLVIPGLAEGQNPESSFSSFRRKPDKFVWNKFERPKVGPKGKVHGRTL
jgi:hypothetical protein